MSTAKGRKARPVSMARRRARTGYLFILPFIIGFVLFMVRPMIQSLIMSFSEVSLTQNGSVMNWVGTINYRYEHMLPVIITTNFDTDGLANHVGGAVWSRLYEMCGGVETAGKDFRQQ